MHAVILAAGRGTRLGAITGTKPKCLVRVAGRSILDRQLDALEQAGIDKATVLVGYRSDQIARHIRNRQSPVTIELIENTNYATTNNMYSLRLAKESLGGKPFILINGDVVFDPEVVGDVASHATEDLIAVDVATYDSEAMKVRVSEAGVIVDIGKDLTPDASLGRSIDLYRFSADSNSILFEEIERIIDIEGSQDLWTEVAIRNLVADGRLPMKPHPIERTRWVEVDDFVDLANADKTFSKLPIQQRRIVFLDMDGTLFLEETPIPGAAGFVDHLRELGQRAYFLSNNSSRAKSDYVEKLEAMGISANESDILLSSDGAIAHILDSGLSSAYVVGTSGLKAMVTAAGIDHTDQAPDCVLLGFDTELTYDKLRAASLILQTGVPYFATHPDVVCPTPYGPVPDIGSLVTLFRSATGREPDRIFGKPNIEMVSHVMSSENAKPEDCLVVGDRIYTDHRMAENIGCEFVCVLSGETSREDLEAEASFPDLVIESVAQWPGLTPSTT